VIETDVGTLENLLAESNSIVVEEENVGLREAIELLEDGAP
jgi:hypothetical protein